MGSGNCKVCSSSVDAVDSGQHQPQSDITQPTNMKKPVDQQPDGDFVEKIVCREDEIAENEMKQFPIDDQSKILLVKQNGVLSALGTKCTHYGALLSTGALGEGRIRCPWHGACFNIKTGDIEDFPGLDSLPCFQVNVTDGQVQVRARKTDLLSLKRIKDMVRRDADDERTYIVIGGGPSGGVCVETLRQEGFTGRIVFVCKESKLPYDRVKVSKAMDFDIDKSQYRTVSFYEQYDIEAMTGVEATSVNSDKKTVSLSNGYIIKYDKLYISTGLKAVKANIPGSELKNVFAMRTYEDAANVHSSLTPETHVVCLGLGFIGMESAAYCANKVAKVTVIGRDTVPFKNVFGPEIGQRIVQLFEENKVEFRFESGIKRCIGDDNGKITAVELNDGTELKCDVCIMGTGTAFYTEFLQNSGINVNSDGSIDTDDYLKTNVPGVYAGGDVAKAPVWSKNNHRASIGHYGLAQYHGRIAGLNMAEKNTQPLRSVPYFWSMLFGKSFRYCGHGRYHELQIDGSVADLKFLAIYYDAEGNVCAMASCQRDPIVSKFAEYQAAGKHLHKSELVDDVLAWTA